VVRAARLIGVRTEPDPNGSEAELLSQYLDYQRDTLLANTDGLDRRQLARSHPPSALTLSGLLYHLALVEEDWTEVRFLGLPDRQPLIFAAMPTITDAELVTLSVMAALLGFTSERRWLRFAGKQLGQLFAYLPKQPGYNKRLRSLADTIGWLIGMLARDTSLWSDDVWICRLHPVECARSRETVKRSELAGFAEYGYCASHSRYFWGLRLHLLATVYGLPVGFALTGAKTDERHTLLAILEDPALAGRTNQMLIADKNYYGREFEAILPELGISLLRPARKGEPARPGARLFKPLRQLIESINDTLKGQLDLEAHGGRTLAGVLARVWQRLLALTAVIWHNDTIGALVKRSLIVYDH
jgi:hypothetical protein